MDFELDNMIIDPLDSYGIFEVESTINELNEIDTNDYLEAVQMFDEARVGGRTAEVQDSLKHNGVSGKIASGALGAVDRTGNVLTNTAKSTKDAVKAYDNITTAGGSMIKSTWNVGMALVNLVTKICAFFAKYVSKGGNMIAKTINNVTKIPGDIRRKLNGSIGLYVTKDDFKTFDILKINLDKFVLLAEQYVRGMTFSDGFFDNDIKYLKRLNDYYRGFAQIKFEKTEIMLRDNLAYDIYFDPKSEYFKKINEVYKWLNSQSPTLNKLQKELEEKFSRSNIDGSFAKMKPRNVEKIKDSLSIIGNTLKILTDLASNINSDINTINVNTEKILKKINKNSKKTMTDDQIKHTK